MKHLLTIAMLTMATLSYAAGWDVEEHPADPLVGINTPYTTYIYTDDLGNQFVVKSNYSGRFGFISNKHTFHNDRGYNVTVIVGMYDDGGNLIENFNLGCVVNPENFRKLYNYSNKGASYQKRCNSIMEHIMHGTGYVRFVAPYYGGGSMDISVPCLPEATNM